METETYTWPPGITIPPDCRPLGDDDTVVASDVIWHSRNLDWIPIPASLRDRPWSEIRRSYTQFTCVARPIYSRENPPPPEPGYVLTEPREVSLIGCRSYMAGHGWGDMFISTLPLSEQPISHLAMSRPADPETLPPMGDSFELVTERNPEESAHGWLVLCFDAWNVIPNRLVAAQIGTRPAIRRIMAIGDLPIARLDEAVLLRVGDLVFDEAGGWLPYVGPTDVLAGIYMSSVYLAFARLRPELRPETHRLLPMDTLIAVTHEVLVRNGGTYVAAGGEQVYQPNWNWVAPTPEQTGKIAYLIPEIIALRKPVETTTTRPRRPVGLWMSAQLIGMLENEPSAEVFRGLVRREHNLIIPRDLHAGGNTALIREWLEEAMAARQPSAEEAVSLRRVYQERIRHSISTTARITVAEGAGVDDDVRVRFTADEYVTQSQSRHDVVSGYIWMPRDVLNQGEDQVRNWIAEHYSNVEIDDRSEGQWRDRDDVDFNLDLVTSTNREELVEQAEDDFDEEADTDRDF